MILGSSQLGSIGSQLGGGAWLLFALIATDPRIIDVAGSYQTIINLSGSYQVLLDKTGSYQPFVDLAGSVDVDG